MKHLAIVFFLAASLLSNAQKKDLKLNLQKDAVYHLDQKSTTLVNSEYSGTKTEVEMVFAGSMSYKVLQSSEESYTLQVKYESMSFEMKMMGVELAGNSTDTAADNKFSNILRAMTLGTFELDITSYGEVTDVRGAEEMLLEAVMTLEDMTDAEKGQLYAQMSPSLGEKAIEGSMELLTLIYPRRAVAVGEQWTTKTRLSGTLDAGVENTYRYATQDDRVDVIEGRGEIDFSKETVQMQSGTEFRYFLDGEIKTDMRIDTKTGWVLSAKYDQFFDGHMTMKIDGGDEMKVPMTMRTNVVCK